MTSCALVILIKSSNDAVTYHITVDLYPVTEPDIGHKLFLNDIVAGRDLTLVISDVQHHIAPNQEDNFVTIVADTLIVDYDAIDLVVGALECYFEGKVQNISKTEEDWHKDAVNAFKNEKHPLHNTVISKLKGDNKEINLYNAVDAYRAIIDLPDAPVS